MRSRSRLTFWDGLVVAGGLGAILALQLWTPEPSAASGYASEVRLDMIGAAPRRTHESAAEAFDIFRENPGYFGAFAVGDGGGYGWSENFSAQGDADGFALQKCAEHADNCRIIARLTPTRATSFKGIVLSYTQARMLDTFPARPGHNALAFDERGNWGQAWNQWSKLWAEQQAMAQCRAREAPGGDVISCRVVLSK